MSRRVIVCSNSFNERCNYHEVVCARALAQLGFEVMVVAADYTASGAVQPWKVAQIRCLFRVRDTTFAPRGLAEITADFRPDAAFLCGPNHGLSYSLHRYLPAGCKIVPVFGDLRESHYGRAGRWGSIRGNPLMKRLVKDRWYRNLMRRSDLILAVTNETVRILREIDAPSWDSRGFMCGLSADPDVFFLDPSRKKPGLKTIVTATRIIPEKPVKEWIQPVLRFLRKNEGWRYLFAGLPPGPEGQAIKRELEDASVGDRFQVLPLLSLSEMNDLFNQADLAVWYLAAISIQQSMLTGVPVLLPYNESLNHLVTEGRDGFYYRSPEHLEERLAEAAARPWDREEIARGNARLSSERTFKEITGRLGLLPPSS